MFFFVSYVERTTIFAAFLFIEVYFVCDEALIEMYVIVLLITAK